MMFDSDFNWTAFDEVEENTTGASADTDTIIFNQKDFEKFLLDKSQFSKIVLVMSMFISSIFEKSISLNRQLFISQLDIIILSLGLFSNI